MSGMSSVRKFELSGNGPYTLAEERTTTFFTPCCTHSSSTFCVPTTLKLCASENGMRGSCMMPRWMSASTPRWRKASSTLRLRRSIWWCSRSFGRSGNGRRSMPTRRVSPWSRRASPLPRLPATPVMATQPGMPGKRIVSAARRVVIAGGAVEAERLAEVQVVAGGEGEPQRRPERQGRHGEQPRQRLQVDERGRLLLGSDHADGHDGRVGLQREPHEAEPEVLQLVPLVKRLVQAANALREDEQRLVGGQQPAAVLGGPHHLAEARIEARHEREGGDPLLDQRPRHARRVELDEEREPEHGRVEGELTGVVRDDEHPPVGRHPLDAVHLDPEVLSVQPEKGSQGGDGEVEVEPIGVDAVLVPGRGELLEPLA